jgi:anaerobic selenocysteine-containing dehydrogenase
LDAGGIFERLALLTGSIGDNRLADKALAEKINRCRRPVVICGANGIAGEAVVDQAGQFARKLAGKGKAAGFFPVLAGANTLAASRIAGDPADAPSLFSLIEDRSIRALVVVEADLLSSFPDLGRAADALARLDLLLVLDCLDSATVRAAQVFFPTRTFFETGGTFVNNEARIQQAGAAFAGGSPIAQVGGGSHPPRMFREAPPGSEPLPARSILRHLAAAVGGTGFEPESDDPEKDLAGAAPEFSGFTPAEARAERGAWASLPIEISEAALNKEAPAETPPENGSLILVEAVFGTEILSRSAPWLQTLASAPVLTLHPDDAARRGLQNGDLCEISTDAGILTVPVRTSPHTAVGTLILPRHRKLGWQIFPRLCTDLAAVDIRKSDREGP